MRGAAAGTERRRTMFKKQIDKLGIAPSLLGFGCMRFPTKDGQIDEVVAEQMLDRAYAAGVTYFDTAYPYHNGTSEPFVGRVMQKYPRDSFYFATKLPLWAVNSLDDAKRLFAEQLERLRTDYVDFYLLHACNKDRFDKMVELGVVEYLVSEKAAGRIKFLGFSFHDNFDAFRHIIEYRDWDFCQIQYNYMDINDQAGDAGVALAEALNVPLVIMEPVKGGSLAVLPEDVMKPFKHLDPDASAASWALRFVASRNNIKVVLSGMSTPEQLEDNLKTFTDFKPLTEEEEEAVKEVADTLHKRVFNGCTGCRYCMPCPNGINIPGNFSIWNDYGMYENAGRTKWKWEHDIADDAKAKNCIECGLCEEACPQHINIRENLKELQEMLDRVTA